MLISGVVTVANLLLSAIIGVRLLLRSRRHRGGPEFWLGVYFSCTAFIGSTLSILVYGNVAGTVPLPEAAVSPLLAIYTAFAGVGTLGVYVFTWRTFRPNDAWARWFVTLGALALSGGYLGEAFGAGFHVTVFPAAPYWVSRIAQVVALVWACAESFRYYGQLRRRLRLGLAEPIVTNRFLLWGCWAFAASINASSDLAARCIYVVMTGQTTELILEAVRPIIVTTVAVTSILGAVAAATLLLTFFPTRAYCRWVEARSAAPEI